jgi:hypothetical protein
MTITDKELLPLAREGAARYWSAERNRTEVKAVCAGESDQEVDVQAALHTARVMIERGWRPMPSVEKLGFEVSVATNDFSGLVNISKLHAALFPPLTPSRVQQAREALGISQDVPDETVAKWIGEQQDER